MRHFATHFDVNYAAKGLAMIESLMKHSTAPGTRVHVLPLDYDAERCVLQAFGGSDWLFLSEIDGAFEEATAVSGLRSTRTHREYCWTVGAVFTDWAMQYNELDEITYLDADTFFFADPEPVFTEIGDKSIAITPHRFAKKDEARLLPNGKYAVQWVTFRGEVGRRCLAEWSANVKKFCFYRHENGLFADQKYLDFWERDYPGHVCEIRNIGVGVAPWNMGQYKFELRSDGLYADESKVVLFHAHEFRKNPDGSLRLTNWPVRETERVLIYAPYASAIDSAERLVAANSLHSIDA